MAKFECPSCGYLLVDASSCSKCGKNVEQSLAEWREERTLRLYWMVVFSGLLLIGINGISLVLAIAALSDPDGKSAFFGLGLLATVAFQIWPACCVARAGIDRQPVRTVTMMIRLSVLIPSVLNSIVGFFWAWLVMNMADGLSLRWYGPGQHSADAAGRLFWGPVGSLVCFVPLMGLTYFLGRCAAWILIRFTREAFPGLELARGAQPGNAEPSLPAAAGVEQAKPGEAGNSV